MTEELERAREAYRRRAWSDAHELFAAAESRGALEPGELELLATCAYLIGREDDALGALERAHQGHLRANDRTSAARCAFWSGLLLMLRGDMGRATGWLARVQRWLEEESRDCVESGYLLVPKAEQHLATGAWSEAYATATDAIAIGERFGDVDLVACARHLQGRALLLQGQIDRGIALLDEVMLSATAGELSPILTGLIYCSVIEACLQVYAFSRAREWTAALSSWCAGQPQMVAFTGTCIVHRAQVMQLSGDWHDALSEVENVCDRFDRGIGQRPPGAAFYERGEVHRLRGDLDAAEQEYRRASQLGCEPQPGLALLRLAQGRTDAAAAALRRVLAAASTDLLSRSRFLPAYVDVLLAVGETAAAREACDELQATAERIPSDALTAISARARAAVELAEGKASKAVLSARQAWQIWDRIAAPYQAARARELVGVACGLLGDVDGHRLELEGARTVYEQLGAVPDATRVSALLAPRTGSRDDAAEAGLTARELAVLRLIATGKTNRAIAGELSVSEKTIERHVSNIFLKLGVATRAAATAYAYEHDLV